MSSVMKILKELIEILERMPVDLTGSLLPIGRSHSKVAQLYEGIRSGQFTDEETARVHLYGASNNAGFSNIKHQLKKRLLDRLLFLDTPSQNLPIERAFFRVHRQFLACQFLLRSGGRQSAVYLLQRIQKEAAQFEFTELEIEILRSLRYHFSVILGDKTSYQQTDASLQRVLYRYQAEIAADGFHEELLRHYVKNRSTKKHLYELAQHFEQQLETILENTVSVRLLHRLFFIRVAKHMCINDYQGTIQSCQNALTTFDAREHVPQSVHRTYLYQLIVSYIQQRAYQEAEQSLQRLFDFLQEGMSNWFKALEIQCKLALHAQKYQQAYATWQHAVNHSSFRKLYPQAKEKWKVLEAYLHFLGQLGKVEIPERMRKFRLGRFINEVPTFSRDKRGLNIPILIIQILFLIYQNRRMQVLERLEALERYSSRYIQRNEHYRSNCFIKMLLQLPKAQFHPKALHRYTEKYGERLRGVPIEMADESHEIEIIPYEQLWEFVLEGLK